MACQNGNLHLLQSLCVFVICRLWDPLSPNVIRGDISKIISCTNEPTSVILVAIYYLVFLKHTSITQDFSNVRQIYVLAFDIAIKYVDDNRVVNATKWASFLEVNSEEFKRMEIITLRHLEYTLDPGYDRLHYLIFKVAKAYYKFSSASEYKSFSSSLSGTGFVSRPSVPLLP